MARPRVVPAVNTVAVAFAGLVRELPLQSAPVPARRLRSVSADGPNRPATALPDSVTLEAERRLCDRARGGDRAALGQLLRDHGPRLFRAVLLPRLGSRAAAEEALSVTC